MGEVTGCISTDREGMSHPMRWQQRACTTAQATRAAAQGQRHLQVGAPAASVVKHDERVGRGYGRL